MLKKAVTAQFGALPRNLHGDTTEHHVEPQSEELVGPLTKVQTKHTYNNPPFRKQVKCMTA